MTEANLRFLDEQVDPIFEPLLNSLLKEKPTDVAKYSAVFLSGNVSSIAVSTSTDQHLGASVYKTRDDAEGVSSLAKSLINDEGASLRSFDDSYRLYKAIMDDGEGVAAADREAYRASLRVLSDAYRLYGPGNLYASFNGGKDAVAVIHLMRAALAGHAVTAGRHFKPRAVYFADPKEFPEVEALVRETVAAYDLNLFEYDCGFVQGLTQCIAGHAAGSVLGFVLGTRAGDPNAGGQQSFAPSSDWMPVSFMRVNPVLDWNYGQVWTFLRVFELPYCSLYDSGFTSLGKVHDTVPNPALRQSDGSYGPASALKDWHLERAGRVKDGKGKDAAAVVQKAPSAGSTSPCENGVLGGPTILRGRPLSVSILSELAAKVAFMAEQGTPPPCLAVVTVSDCAGATDENGSGAAAAAAAKSYLKMMVQVAKKCGVQVRHAPFVLPPCPQPPQDAAAAATAAAAAEVEEELRGDAFSLRSAATAACVAWVASVGADPTVDAVLLALPLPPARGDVVVDQVLAALPLAKDVDGASPSSRANFFSPLSAPPSPVSLAGLPRFAPCTALSVMALLGQVPGLVLKGKDVAVVGATGAVGQPLAHLLLEAGATVICLHVNSRGGHTLAARTDIVVACAGRAGLVHANWVKAGAVVVDVGVNIKEATEGSPPGIVGDVAFGPVCSALGPEGVITPVPGGVGPVTAAILMRSTLAATAFGRHQQQQQQKLQEHTGTSFSPSI
eukprot:CAMPEP_0171990390 /NCGR_PEP_ID=MMETSP0993-20121228/276899_1 /TAXON_ID=483369 /ORGANISM="non described non described, Strain CCMP2098" /LENGTH=727 /DNA_ID=CAMNT_0012643399 /DNA_START=41 /DNA_END=2224 /DNA_ORIENTATION=-